LLLVVVQEALMVRPEVVLVVLQIMNILFAVELL
jgi:hypothetical protein